MGLPVFSTFYLFVLYLLFFFLFLVGVGGIEAEAIMLGQSISMVLPEVIGYKLVGSIDPLATSTDVVLTITKVTNGTVFPYLLYTIKASAFFI